MELVIKQLSAEEEECFAELCCGLTRFNWSHRPDQTGLEDALVTRRAKIRQRLQNTCDTELFLLAFIGSNPVGYAIAEVDRQSVTPTVFLDELYVIENQRGYGIGKRLMNEVTLWAREKQASRLRLNTFVWNDGGRRFYESQGFSMWAVCYELGLNNVK